MLDESYGMKAFGEIFPNADVGIGQVKNVRDFVEYTVTYFSEIRGTEWQNMVMVHG